MHLQATPASSVKTKLYGASMGNIKNSQKAVLRKLQQFPPLPRNNVPVHTAPSYPPTFPSGTT